MEGWIQATYDGTALHMKGDSTATELGITVFESVEASLRAR